MVTLCIAIYPTIRENFRSTSKQNVGGGGDSREIYLSGFPRLRLNRCIIVFM